DRLGTDGRRPATAAPATQDRHATDLPRRAQRLTGRITALRGARALDDTVAAGEVGRREHVFVAQAGELCGQARRLAVAALEHEAAARNEDAARVGGDPLGEADADHRLSRLVETDLRLKRVELVRRDVRRIRDDQVERTTGTVEQIPVEQRDPAIEARAGSVLGGERERGQRAVDAHHPRARVLRGDLERDGARAFADVGY